MVNFNWKKIAIVLADIAIGVYLVLAITAFNRPDELNDVCSEVKINIKDGIVKGFLNADEVKLQLQRAHLYPLGELMTQVKIRSIEELLEQNPFVENAECYKTQTGRVFITLTQRLPVIHIKADNGDDYYVDEHGNIMPNTQYVSDLVIATGNIQKKYAQSTLMRIGNFLLQHPLWRSQIEQINVLYDGSIEMVPRVGDHIVYLGQPTNLQQKLTRLEKFYRYGLSQAGWNKYSYINLEFSNQIICKKRKISKTTNL
jgi:cell division protein FtsQ